MTLHRYAKARDANEPEIVEALRRAGATVVLLEPSVPGLPDLLVGFRGVNLLLEVKLPAGPKGGTSHSYLTPDQSSFFETWRGAVYVVRGAEEALWLLQHGGHPGPKKCTPPHSEDCRR